MGHNVRPPAVLKLEQASESPGEKSAKGEKKKEGEAHVDLEAQQATVHGLRHDSVTKLPPPPCPRCRLESFIAHLTESWQPGESGVS